MSESREQFRDRIGRVAYSGLADETGIPADEWEAWTDTHRATYMDVAEAVYAEALRDVRAAVGDYLTGDGDGTTIGDEIQAWAWTGCGIDLDGGE